MSVDPLTSGLAPANIAAIIADELAALAADAQTLGKRLGPGDVVTATVLPSNGLTDLLEVDGLRVAAELPPTLLPGQRISVQVMGLRGDRIELTILAAHEDDDVSPRAGAPTAAKSSAPAPAEPTPRSPGPALGVPSPGGGRETSAGYVGMPYGRSSPRPSLPVAPEQESIEARLAASRAATPPTTARAAGGGRGPAPAQRTAPPPPSVPRPFIAMRSLAALAAAPSPTAATARPAASPTRAPAEFTDPATLLRALRLPVTATNLASARMALEAPDRLPNALRTLELALADRTDPRLTTLSTLTAFIDRLDPRSPVLGEQIAAYVDHIVVGAEPKIVALARAAGDIPPPLAGVAPPPLALERVALARAMLDSDLKTQLLALTVPAGGAPAASASTASLDAAVAGVLTAVTALQLNAASTLAAVPDGIAFTLPLVLPSGYAQAQVRVDRDAEPGGRPRLDGDTFHIAFILETRHLGTIAIDLSTVGRAVTVSVKTEGATAQRAFSAALDGLTSRLEHLRYSVAKADAVVAPPASASAARPAPAGERPAESGPEPNRLVDTDA